MIKRFILPVLLSLLPLLVAPLAAQEAEDPVSRWQEDPTTVFDASEVDLDDFLWIARPVVVFGDAPQMPAFQEQMERIADRADDLARRDVVVITDTDPDTLSDVRRRLRPRGFQLTVLGKDGEVSLRKPFPWDVREITRSIDKMPMRQREMREGS
ncbi:DUF4174 domain-containing protein [Palleronia sp.]|uniref:DUF4174 domain-containing protein n=1 Tax=Palleronia sp. TaxID=1940284 RepID=UPI0035C82855